MQTYYIRYRGQVSGPYTMEQLQQKVAARQVGATHMVSTDRVEWVLAKEVTGLFQLPRPPVSEAVPPTLPPPPAEPPPFVAVPLADAGFTAPAIRQPSRAPMIVLFVAVVCLAGVVIAYFATREGDVARALGTSVTITNPTDEVSMPSALGLVVCGAKITNFQGAVFEVPASKGTAFAVTVDGVMLTNRHVIDKYAHLRNASKLRDQMARDMKLQSIEPKLWVIVAGKKHDAQLMHSSTRFDLAVVRIGHQFPKVFRLLNAGKLPIGQDVWAGGFPGSIPLSDEELGRRIQDANSLKLDVLQHFQNREFAYSLTKGAVSSLQRDDQAGVDWIQHNADINPGNSGGPLMRSDGTVVAINTLGFTAAGRSGMFYSFPLAQVREEIAPFLSTAHWDQ